MRKTMGCLVLTLLVGCVTEGGEVSTGKNPEAKGPVEMAEDAVAKRLQRLRYVHGRELLAEVESIIAYKELALSPVLAALPESDSRTKATLLYILGYIPSPESHAAVSAHLKDRDEAVRYEAAAASLQLGDQSAVPTLVAFLDSEDKRLRYKAIEALKSSTKQDFGYDFNAPESERAAAIGRWQDWWSSRRSAMIYRGTSSSQG